MYFLSALAPLERGSALPPVVTTPEKLYGTVLKMSIVMRLLSKPRNL